MNIKKVYANYQPIRQRLYTINDIVFDEIGDAEEVLTRMRKDIDRYGMVSVGDFYCMTCKYSDYTSHKYGWRDLKEASVVKKGNGYVINFPKIIALEE